MVQVLRRELYFKEKHFQRENLRFAQLGEYGMRNHRAPTLLPKSQRARAYRKGTDENKEASALTSEDLTVWRAGHTRHTSPKYVKTVILQVQSI